MPSCTYNFGNSSFNLQPLTLAGGGWYNVHDDRNNAASLNYTYFFNVCANVDLTGFFPFPTTCNVTYPGPGLPPTALGAPSPAYQYANMPTADNDKCHRLGGDVTAGGNIKWGLYDINNPSTGVVIQYLGGASQSVNQFFFFFFFLVVVGWLVALFVSLAPFDLKGKATVSLNPATLAYVL